MSGGVHIMGIKEVEQRLKMNEHYLLYQSYRKLAVSLIHCMRCHNCDGLKQGGVERVEDLMRICACLEEPLTAATFGKPIERLHEAAEKGDDMAAAGILERDVYPLVKAWLQSDVLT